MLEEDIFCIQLQTIYQQIDGLAIGASSSVFLAELFMMRLEKKALRTFAHPPETWYRYVDDTFTYMLEKYINDFLLHLNQQHERIKITMELEVEREIPFLDTMIRVEEDGSYFLCIQEENAYQPISKL